MTEQTVKIIPKNDVKKTIFAQLIEQGENTAKFKIEKENDFEIYQLFEIIIEQSKIIKIFNANLVKKYNDVYSFSFDKQPQEITKREYERCTIPLEVTGKKFSAETINISAGGMKLKSEKELKKNKVYSLNISFEAKNIEVDYKVLRSEKEINNFITSGQFIKISSSDKAFIIQQNLKKKLDLRYGNSKAGGN